MKCLQDIVEALPGLRRSMLLACDWLADVAQVQGEQLTVESNTLKLAHARWKGAFRGEYTVATRRWTFFCPVWHGGQAVKALVQAYQVAPNSRYLEAAHQGARFILHNQVQSGADAGLILAYEGLPDKVYTSAILEGLDGLLVLGRATQRREYIDAAVSAARWCLDRAWLKGQGLLRDLYDPKTLRFIDGTVVTKDGAAGRPLADDAIWLKCFHCTREGAYRQAFFEVLDRLLRDERPAGNWVDYGPCLPRTGECHPRHAYWWGLPMVDGWIETRETKWLDAARRSGQWYVSAQRTDGGLFRFTDSNFNTACFGHATSGIACAAILWIQLFEQTGESRWLEPLHRALKYCMSMQFTEPADPNLKGCILEKILPPDGSDRSPYYVRDLGTIFFVQAAAQLLLATNSASAQPRVVVSLLSSSSAAAAAGARLARATTSKTA